MISKSATKEYLERSRKDWSRLKVLKELTLWRRLDKLLPEGFTLKTDLWKHQVASFIAGIHNKSFLYFLDMGLGKSAVVLNNLSYYRYKEEFTGRGLILSPNEVGISSWEEQIEEHSDFTYTSLIGKGPEKWKILEASDTDLYIISYDGLLSMLTELKEIKDCEEKKKKQKPVPRLVQKFSKLFQALVLDESQLCKNHKTLNYKLCNKIAKVAEFRYGLTGTPFGRNPIDLWSQFFLIDRGETLGTTLGFFREIFFIKESNHFGSKWVFNKKMEKKLHKTLCHKSLRYSEKEAEHMPPKAYSRVKVSFPSENYIYYEKAVKGLVEARGDYEMLKNAFMRLRQIRSGFIDFKDDEGNRERITFKENPILDALIDDLERTPEYAKVIIFYELTPFGDMIEERLKKRKIGFQRLYSGTKDKIAAKDLFVKESKYKVLLSNSKSGGVNLNLQVADYEFFAESPSSPIIRAQAEKRAPRGDKTDTTYIRDYIVKNSVDEDIQGFLKEGKDLFMALVEGKKLKVKNKR